MGVISCPNAIFTRSFAVRLPCDNRWLLEFGAARVAELGSLASPVPALSTVGAAR